jgi:hypothetical protein
MLAVFLLPFGGSSYSIPDFFVFVADSEDVPCTSSKSRSMIMKALATARRSGSSILNFMLAMLK